MMIYETFFFSFQDMVTFENTLKEVWSLTYPLVTAPGKGWRHVFIGRYLLILAYLPGDLECVSFV